MGEQPLEKRVEVLEREVERLKVQMGGTEVARDWRVTVGMFKDDPVFREISDAGKKLREAERG